MTLYRSNPAVANGQTQDGPISLGVEFYATGTGCTLYGFRWYHAASGFVGSVTSATLYNLGSSTQLTTPMAIPCEVLASSEPSGAGFGAAAAFVSAYASKWIGTSPTVPSPQWLKRRLPVGSTEIATGYTITPDASSASVFSPKDWKFQGSNDDSSWTDLDTQTNVTAWTNSTAKHYTFSNTTFYRYYRILMTAHNGGSNVVIVTLAMDGITTWNRWSEMELPSPYGLTSGTHYRAALLHSASRSNSGPTISTDLTSGPLTVPTSAHSTSGNNNYAYGASLQNPTGVTGANYQLDIIVEQTTGVTYNGIASLTATSVLAADGYIGSPTISAAASLTATSALSAAAAVTRTVSAALTATSTLTSTAQPTLLQATAALTATSVLTATPEPPKSPAATAALYAASALFVEATLTAVGAAAALTATSALTVAGTAFTPWVEPNDPRTGKPQYRLIVANRDGTRYAEITNATMSPIESGVGDGSSFNFEMPTADPKMAYAIPPGDPTAHRQAQVWRGTGLEFRGPIVQATDNTTGATTLKCRDPYWYLESGRRVIGAIPKRDLLVNGSFATGEPPWTGAYAPGSVPAAQPVRNIIDVDFFGTGMKALQISGVDKVVTVTKEVKTEAVFVPNSASYLPGGDAAIKAVAQLMPKTGTLNVRVDGFTADNRINGDPGDGMALSKARADAAKATILGLRPGAVITTAGYGYYQQIPGGQAANRRVVITWNGVQEASGHRQYEVQTLSVTQPVAKKAPLPLTFVGWTKITKWLGPSKDGWGVYIQIVNPAKPKVIVDSAHADIDEKTPRDRWIRMEASVEVPADGISYEVQVRFYPPAGTALWTRGGLYPGDQLAFFDADQALIIKGLVEHAQDTTIGKGNLSIATNCQPTGITRTREYPYDERMPIETAISEIAALYRGPEVTMQVTATTQTVTTHHPRQGKATSEVLVHGGSVVAYEAPTDTRDSASSIILQADQSGADREEGYASDPLALDGLLLERVISTEGETPVTELEEGATHALGMYKRPQPSVWVTIDPRRTGYMLGAVGQGDTVRAIIQQVGIDGTHRFVKRRLHPAGDMLEMMLTPEA